MDFLCSGALVRAVSDGAVALGQHLRPVQHHLLRPVFGLCWTALGLRNELLAYRPHYFPRGIRNFRSSGLTRSRESPVAFEVWACQGTWLWYVGNPERNGGTIGAAATETEAIREARSSIEEMSARCVSVPALQFAGDATEIEESNLNATTSPPTSSSFGQDVAANLSSTTGPLPPDANPNPARETPRRDKRAPDARRPGHVVRTRRSNRR